MPEEWSIKTLYMASAALGGAVLTLQMILLVIGGVDADIGEVDDFDPSDAGDGFGFISIRSVAGFFTFFGLAGWWGVVAEWGPGRTMAVALGSGALMMILVAWIMSMQSKLYSEGNLKPENALGKPARVYLKIPGDNTGKGKITVSVQGRTHEFSAVSTGQEIPTGSDVRVVKMLTEDTFEVVPLD